MILSVVTPEGPVLEGPCRSLSVQAHDGSMGILPGHAPMVVELGAGVLTAVTEEGTREVVLAGGYLQVLEDKVSVLATESWELGAIDREQAQKDLDAALAITAHTDEERGARDRAIARARALLANV